MDAKTIKENNERILLLMSAYLNCCADALDAESVRDIAQSCHVDERYAYAELLGAACGLDTHGADALFFREWMLPMLQMPSYNAFTRDAYYRTVQLPQVQRGVWTLTHGRFAPYEAFVCGDLISYPNGKILPQIGFFNREFTYPSVQENGREWMSVTPNEIVTMSGAIARAHGRVLTYGLGLGYFTFHAARSARVSQVCVVERDADVIALFKQYLLSQFENAHKIRILHADAFDYARDGMGSGGYDFIYTDIWHDPSDGVPLYLRMKECERYAPQARFEYWCEDTIRYYL